MHEHLSCLACLSCLLSLVFVFVVFTYIHLQTTEERAYASEDAYTQEFIIVVCAHPTLVTLAVAAGVVAEVSHLCHHTRRNSQCNECGACTYNYDEFFDEQKISLNSMPDTPPPMHTHTHTNTLSKYRGDL